MTRALWIPVVAVAAIASAGTACAQADMGLRRMQEAQAERERALVPMTPLAPERLQPATQRDDFRPPGRMSVEERRQLRRDIDEAGRELYRRHPHHSQR